MASRNWRPLASGAIGAALCAVLVACANLGAGDLSAASRECARGGSHSEVQGGATVVRLLGMRQGESGTHEAFLVRMQGRIVRIEDNVDITGPIPLHRGEHVELRGQYECDDGVIHWTHRDPGGRHMPGFIEADGRRYS